MIFRLHRMRTVYLLLVLATVGAMAAATIPRPSFLSSQRKVPSYLQPRGGDSSSSSNLSISSFIPQASMEELRRRIVDEGAVVDDFGSRAEALVNEALAAAVAAGMVEDQSLQELEAAIDAPLHVLYLKQLGYLRQNALQQYRSSKGDYESMLQADTSFVRSAERLARDGSDWDHSQERAFLQAVMNLSADHKNKAEQVQLNAAQQQQTAMQFLQSQQQMIQQLQMQLYGQSSPWNVGAAYRIPDTNFNLQGSYQNGRANLQLSCVPDEYAPFLGPNGFTNGVGPGNLGLSLNLSL